MFGGEGRDCQDGGEAGPAAYVLDVPTLTWQRIATESESPDACPGACALHLSTVSLLPLVCMRGFWMKSTCAPGKGSGSALPTPAALDHNDSADSIADSLSTSTQVQQCSHTGHMKLVALTGSSPEAFGNHKERNNL